jgi:hypothetical protein
VRARAEAARPALPPHDAAATTPHGAYDVDAMAPAGGRAGVEAWAARLAEVRAGAAARGGEFPASVLAALATLPPTATDPHTSRRLRCLALAAAALRVAAAPRTLRPDPKAGGDAALAASVGLPEDLLSAMLAAHADRGTRSSLHTLALRALGAVCLLLAHDGDMPPSAFNSLRADLKLPPKETVALLREAGATAVSAGRAPADSAGKTFALYRVRLLTGGAGETLGDCFPKLKVGRRAGA